MSLIAAPVAAEKKKKVYMVKASRSQGPGLLQRGGTKYQLPNKRVTERYKITKYM